MTNTITLNPSKGLAITYLVRLSIASPSGGRSEIENLNVIKKIREGFLDFPYASSQAMKRALRDTLKGLGFPISPVINSSPARTAGNPVKYIDDDLFGYMDPSSKKEVKVEEDSEDTEAEGSGGVESVTPPITKDMIDKLKPKKVKEKIEKYFTEHPTKESIAFSELANLELTGKEIKSIEKSVTKDDAAIFQKMLQNLNGVRKAVISMTPLLSLSAFDDSVDFGANMMGLKGGVSPMPYETEVHRGWYRITLYIDLDRIGTGDGFIKKLEKIGEEKSNIIEIISQKDKDDKGIDFDFIHKSGEKFIAIKKEYSPIESNAKYCRAKALLDAIRFLAPSGRSSNWLIDLTPKLMVAAYVKGARTPFLETPLLDETQKDKNVINLKAINTVKDTFVDGIEEIENNSSKKLCLVVGYREDLIEKPNSSDNAIDIQTMKSAFDTINRWLKEHFNVTDQNTSSTDQTQTKQGN